MPSERSGGLSPDEIVTRGFPTQFRGFSETEVRNFLKRIADELAAAQKREQRLDEQVAELSQQLRNPTPLTEAELLERLGAETARVLRSAQEAADDIRDKAQTRASGLVEEAQERARVMRAEADATIARMISWCDSTSFRCADPSPCSAVNSFRSTLPARYGQGCGAVT